MPGLIASRRRARYDIFEDEEDSSGVATPSTSGSSSKRARLNVNGDSTPTSRRTTSDSYTSPMVDQSQPESLRSRLSRKPHQPGAIVRVKLADFVTYTAVEFFPGPSLNMVIGPNGTGKSTLVCAICLGLGWGAQHLGRAKEVSEYVKHGCQEATIEIELAGDRTYPKVVIGCKITREGNKSTFSFNGKQASKKDILKVARHFSIQIDNLCQFLPQDKVVEFAAMTPVELLRSTQRAVAPQEMLDLHDKVIKFRKDQKVVEAENASNQDILTSLENRQRMQQADVDRMRERQEIQQRVQWLAKSRPVWQYRDAHVAWNEHKTKCLKATEELSDLHKEVEPLLRAVRSKEKYQDRIEQVVKERKVIVDKAQKDTDGIDRKLKDLFDSAEGLEHERKVEVESGLQTKKDVVRLSGNVNRLKKQMEESPPELDTASYNEKIRECSRAVDEYTGQGQDIKRKQTDLVRTEKEKQEQIQRAERDLKDLDSQAGQQMRKLAGISPQAHQAWQWIQQNQDKFEKHVYGPPIVECSVKDPKYLDQIETLFQQSLLTPFTVQTKNDFATLSNYLNDHLHLKENNIKTVANYDLSHFKPPIPKEQLPQYGLDSWALDYFEGPEPVLAMLCSEVRIHATALASRDTTAQQFEMIRNGPIDNWVTSRHSYKIIRRREYGPGATSSQVRDVKKASMWTDQPVDRSARSDLQGNIHGWQEELDSCKQQIEDLQAELAEIRDKIQDKKQQVTDLNREKGEKQKIIAEFKALPVKLAQQEEKLAVAQASVTGIKERVEVVDTKLDAIVLQRGQLTLDYASAVETLRSAHHDLYIAGLMNIEAASEVETLVERNSSVKDHLDAKQREVDGYNATKAAARKKAQDSLALLKPLLTEAQSDPAYDAFMKSLPTDSTGEEMEEELSAEQARLDLTHEGNGGVIKEYEQRQKRVEALKATLHDGKSAFDEYATKIQDTRDKWEPELDALVAKISHSFSFNMGQISCAGEVGVFKDESDFDNWAIQIMVKFRENEPLTQLDSHRQSGGERAVSTIFYLMSLQSLTRSPFRVVDEINQGMDPRNERLVHKRMVSIACGGERAVRDAEGEGEDGEDRQGGDGEEGGGEGSQYFLITPKLLNGLEYARGMQVLCIASGEQMPSSSSSAEGGAAE